MRGNRRPNGFPSGEKHGPDWYWRINRAHMNTVENLPIYAALVLAGVFLGLEDGFVVVAWVGFGARVLQSIFHIASGRSLAVNFRFAAFCVQLLVYVELARRILTVAA